MIRSFQHKEEPMLKRKILDSKKHAALNHLLEVKNFHLKQAVVLHTKNVEVEESITYLPIYMTSFLRE